MYPMMGDGWQAGLFPGAAFMLGLPFVVLALLLWSIFWKGWALWLAARRNERVWFVLLLVLNTAGLLEIAYIFLVAKKSDVPAKKEKVAEHA